MADIPTTTPIAIRRHDPPRPSFTRSAIGASLNAISRLGDAFKMAYVAPYSSHREPRIVPDDDPDGRDPSW
ncbi:hypothetical protein [Mesorhizobium sp. B2-3-4]|uniref:hypothetical protein n=1 Tax=Mesorhizobium sp. B2-3-4 TaxID=2589959 RepID=UPI00112B651F|nr:hypothetical protein [Mesorhizobium sp. B2-3-4]TPM37379.1 hypothetical protein FJ967_15210 [Mesorhizobium sp. B2-3-4]